MAASEWVFPMKTTPLLQKQLTKGSVCDEQLISDQPGGWLIKEKKKKTPALMLGTAEEGPLGVARRRRSTF